MAILEEAVGENRRISIEEARQLVRDLGLQTPDEAREMIRADRDAR